MDNHGVSQLKARLQKSITELWGFSWVIWQRFKKAIMVERVCATLNTMRIEGKLMTGLSMHFSYRKRLELGYVWLLRNHKQSFQIKDRVFDICDWHGDLVCVRFRQNYELTLFCPTSSWPWNTLVWGWQCNRLLLWITWSSCEHKAGSLMPEVNEFPSLHFSTF